MQKFVFLYILFISFTFLSKSETVTYDHVLTDEELIELLITNNNSQLTAIQEQYNKGEKEAALEQLALYFKERFSERYFFDWKNFEKRFEEYNKIYSNREDYHFNEAQNHLKLYPAETQWKIGFKNIKGETVEAYPYRHLTRQHKAGDIALLYFYKNDKSYLDYIPKQASSLNAAFDKGLVETIEDGNGAYEVYRAGNRMYNWLFVHQVLLSTNEYTWQQQITMIRTFLHTGAQLYQNNPKFKWGNHQTRGMSALAMLSILFPEIKGTDKWQNLAFSLLEEHLEKEIYNDGFQIERTVHYHIADIENYFYPYQLAKLNRRKLKPIWDVKLNGLFETLVKIAFPNKTAPVLQDDTSSPWSEMNLLDETMAMGAVLFARPEYKYFASKKLSSEQYWWFREEQLDKIENIKPEKPSHSSLALPETGYYIMRKGWNENDLFMITSAGLTPQKPDHQHGDMLGIGAYAHGNVILPNYQVRYYLPDLEFFKNSWVKNVMLVDSILLGQEYKGNKGGSGFGKFGKLPVPKVLAWASKKEFDFFAGTHNGFKDAGVEYYRSILFVKDGFWIVSDKLKSDNKSHTAQQIWQGHYDIEIVNKHIRSVFPNGAGLEIIQLNEKADTISKASVRSKGRAVFEKDFETEDHWTTLLFPFSDFEERLDNFDENDYQLKGWRIMKGNPEGMESNAELTLSKEKQYFLSNVSSIKTGNNTFSVLNQKTDLWIEIGSENIQITNCGINNIEIQSKNQLVEIKPGITESLKL
jgi:hypothetical protein